VVPAWAASDWLAALWVAGIGQLLLLLGGVAISLILLLATMASSGLESVDWGSVAVSPLARVLGWAGGADTAPLLLTGVVYTFLVYRFAMRRVPSATASLTSSQPRAFAAAGKIGVVSAGILLVVGILLNTFAEDTLSGATGAWAARDLDLTSLVFFCLFIGSLTALLALLSVQRVSLLALLGLRLTLPASVRSGLVGAQRTVIIASAGMLALHTLGTLLDDLSREGIGPGAAVSSLLREVASLLIQWLDTGMLLLLGATKFLHDGGFQWSLDGDGVSGWMWLAIPILLGAYVAGGIHAAKSTRPNTQAEAAKAAVPVGPIVALAGLLVAMAWTGQDSTDDIVPVAIVLPTLWGVIALGGAWLWANQQGLASGLILERAQQPPAPPTPPTSDASGSPAGQAPPPRSTQPPPAEEQPPPPSPGTQWPSSQQPPPPPTPQPAPPTSGLPHPADPSTPTDRPADAKTGDEADPPPESSDTAQEPVDTSVPEADTDTVVCPTCGKNCRGRFCGACGTKVRD
jgi:hypothetical protein